MLRRSRSTGRVRREEYHATPTYSTIRTNMLKLTPGDMKCRMYCSGKKCKYCNVLPSTSDQAIPGLYSTWITPHILAMARPTPAHTDLIEHFQKANVRTVINLQEPGEHKFCGPPLLSSGFTYDPEELLMSNENLRSFAVFFYNFPMPDFKTCSVAFLLDVVKVMQFAWDQGRIAVHCHAGHGRTGMLIAAFLIYWEGVTPCEAVKIVRAKRPDSVQSIDQVTVLNDFYSMLKNHASVLPTVTTLINGSGHWCPLCVSSSAPEVDQKRSIFSALFVKRTEPVTTTKVPLVPYTTVLDLERDYLAGMERKEYRNVPKVIVTLVKLLLERVFDGVVLHLQGRDINDCKIEWEVGKRIAKFKEVKVLNEMFQAREPCGVCTYIRTTTAAHLVTVSNCGHVLKGANYCTLIALLDRNLQELERPDAEAFSDLITINTNLARHMGAHTDEPWKTAFAVIVSAFSHFSPSDYYYFAQIIHRFFQPELKLCEATCARIRTLLERLAETRRFWHDNELREEDRHHEDDSREGADADDGASETYRKITIEGEKNGGAGTPEEEDKEVEMEANEEKEEEDKE
ncbi:hypothetical protein PMAYCL1PPCAC_19380 [Pristionchus mayeri]|uniref:Uncharacterized protein n=1 Tax=Pristionchus mayeri TaxID=1317129 RepID=A0AAN5I2K7_9BILA|nr:hypothetical protein PMAYCL1PPCAC_19380 [Pristionchus mayeri]